MRRTAERVDEQLLTQMQAQAISGPWAAGNRILVCISEDGRAEGLVRYAKRLADRLHAPWTALHIESRRTLQLNEAQRDAVAGALRLAQALGGDPVTIPGGARRIADDLVAYAKANNITQIIIGKSVRTPWFELLHGSVVHDLLAGAGNIGVNIVAGELTAEPSGPARTVRTADAATPLDLRPYGLAILISGLSLGFGLLVQPWIGEFNVDLVFLVGVVAAAARYGRWPSLLASIVSAFGYNFFFTEPIYTFAISDPRNVVAVVVFTVVAIIVSSVAARARVQALAAMGRARTTEALYAFSRKLAGVGALDDVLWVTAYQAALMLRVRVVLLLPEDGVLVLKSGYPPEDMLAAADLAAAKWSWETGQPAGRGSDTLTGAKWLFLPMATGRGPVGIVGIDSDKQGPLLTPDQRRLLDALIDQGALAIERVHLVEDVERTKRTIETDKLRSALLTSLSHDLKTPLASVLGSASALRDLSSRLSDAEKADLVTTIIDEAERLNRFIANLLDMTRLESGAIIPKTALYDVGDIAGSALRRAEKILAQHKTQMELEPDLPMLDLDPVLFEQVLFNLLDNAAKYAPPGTTIRVRGERFRDTVRLQIIDEGEGIPPGEAEHIFDRFHRAQKGDQVRPGTGLGLTISRGFIEAMHGTILASNRVDRGGAVFTIELPIPAAGTHQVGPE